VDQSRLIFLATSVIFQKICPKENNDPVGENSPNLVTLRLGIQQTLRILLLDRSRKKASNIFFSPNSQKS
jgi:hypothetical protein